MNKENAIRRLNKISPKKSIIVGAIIVFLGAMIYLSSTASGVSSGDKVKCESQVAKMYEDSPNDLISKCDSDIGFVTMMNAKHDGLSAEETAKAISNANNSDLSGGFISMFLSGIFFAVGAVLVINGILRIKKNNTSM